MVIVHRNYVKLLSALENHVLPMFVPYSGLIKPNSGQLRLKNLTFGQTFQLRLEIRLISSICI